MKYILIVLGIVLGVVLALCLIAYLFFLKVRGTLRQMGFKANNIKEMKEEVESINERDSNRARSISGMTKLLLPTIQRDFPDFNEKEMYNKTEDALRKVFKAIENKDVEALGNLQYLREPVREVIEDSSGANISEIFDNIEFYQFAISSYEKKGGAATVTVSVSVSYYYKKTKDNDVIIDNTKYKKQTRYKCNFIYVYDLTKVSDSAKVLAINCPNCGAAITTLGHKYCDYCGSAVQEVNLKSWECSSYEEF